MSAKVLNLYDQEALWRARCRVFARIRLSELGCPDDQADLLIAELLSRAGAMPAAASNASQIEDYYSRVVVSCVELLWSSHLQQQNRSTTSFK
jgi:hypothetical protein